MKEKTQEELFLGEDKASIMSKNEADMWPTGRIM